MEIKMKKIILFLILFFIAVGYSQTTKNISIYRGDQTILEFKILGNYSSSLFQFYVKRNRNFGTPYLIVKSSTDTSQIKKVYSAPYTTVKVYLKNYDTYDIVSAKNVYDLVRDSVYTVFTGNFDLSFDVANDLSNYIFDYYYTKDQTRQIAGDSANVALTKAKQAISDSLGQYLQVGDWSKIVDEYPLTTARLLYQPAGQLNLYSAPITSFLDLGITASKVGIQIKDSLGAVGQDLLPKGQALYSLGSLDHLWYGLYVYREINVLHSAFEFNAPRDAFVKMDLGNVDFRNGDGTNGGSVKFTGQIIAPYIPAQADTAGLPVGTLYYDTNGFIKRKAN